MVVLLRVVIISSNVKFMGFPSGSAIKNPPVNAGEVDLIPGWERAPREGNDSPLQYSCLEIP